MKLIFILISLSFSTFAQYQLEKIVHSQDQAFGDSQINAPLDEDASDKIEEEVIENTQAASIDDVLRQSEAATTARGPRNSGESIQIRGLDASKVFIMIDGARQNFRGAHTSMIPVDLENLKSVDVYKSSADFSKGGSLGGGIQFVTKDPEDYLKKGENYGGEFKYQNNSANAENIYNAKNVFRNSSYSGLISLTAQKANNMALNDGEELPNSAYQDFIGLIKIKVKGWTLSHETFYREDNAPLDPSLDPPASIQSLQADSEMKKETTNLSYNKKGLSVSAYYNRFQIEKTQREDKSKEIRSIDTTGMSFAKQIEGLRFGAEAYQDALDSEKSGQEVTSYPKAQSLNASAFMERDFRWGKWTLTPGARANFYSMQDLNKEFKNKGAQAISKKLKLAYELGKDSYVYAAYSEGFNAPKVTEVYPSGLHSPGDGWIIRDNYFVPNLDLEHETSANKEVGIELKNYVFDYQGQLRFSASVYENDVKDYIKINRIDRSTEDDQDGTSQFINVPNVSLYGGEAKLALSYDIFEWKIAHSIVRGKNETEDLYLEDLPADQYTYAFNIYLDRYRAQVGYLGIQALEQNRVNPETIQRTEKTPGHFIHNIYGRKDLGENFEVGLRVDNLGNKKYRRHGSFLYESREDYKITFKYKVKTL